MHVADVVVAPCVVGDTLAAAAAALLAVAADTGAVGGAAVAFDSAVAAADVDVDLAAVAQVFSFA
jgi:hypothetical protein